MNLGRLGLHPQPLPLYPQPLPPAPSLPAELSETHHAFRQATGAPLSP